MKEELVMEQVIKAGPVLAGLELMIQCSVTVVKTRVLNTVLEHSTGRVKEQMKMNINPGFFLEA